MTFRTAKSLLKLRSQIDAAWPGRRKGADGTIGDEAHRLQGDTSDHNPWFQDATGVGVVTALDITHDPDNGVDIDKLSDALIASRDSRIKYVIANGLIAGPYTGWNWVQNSGHYDHIHISVNPQDYDNTKEWKIGEDMADKVNLNTARILAAACLARDGYDGRPNAHQGHSDEDLKKYHVGADLTNEYVRSVFFASGEASKALDIKHGVYTERDQLKKRVKELETLTNRQPDSEVQKKLDQIKEILK